MIRKFIIIYVLLIFVIWIAECTINSNMINEYLSLSKIWSSKEHSINYNHLIQAESQYLKVFSKFFFIVIIVFMYDN